MMKEGTILDATITNAHSSITKKAGETEPQMHSVANGKRWFHCSAKGLPYGMRCHIGVNVASGLAHSVVSTTANVHELTTAAEGVKGTERVIVGDAGPVRHRKG